MLQLVAALLSMLSVVSNDVCKNALRLLAFSTLYRKKYVVVHGSEIGGRGKRQCWPWSSTTASTGARRETTSSLHIIVLDLRQAT